MFDIQEVIEFTIGLRKHTIKKIKVVSTNNLSIFGDLELSETEAQQSGESGSSSEDSDGEGGHERRASPVASMKSVQDDEMQIKTKKEAAEAKGKEKEKAKEGEDTRGK